MLLMQVLLPSPLPMTSLISGPSFELSPIWWVPRCRVSTEGYGQIIVGVFTLIVFIEALPQVQSLEFLYPHFYRRPASAVSHSRISDADESGTTAPAFFSIARHFPIVHVESELSGINWIHSNAVKELCDFTVNNLVTSPKPDQFMSAQEKQFLFQIFPKRDATVVVITSDDYPTRASFAICQNMMAEFEERNGKSISVEVSEEHLCWSQFR
jgi:hypothetical protein